MPRVKNYAPDASIGEKIRKNLVHWAGNAAHAVVPPIHALLHSRESFVPGISAEVITRNDPWLFEALASVREFVDEFVIIDSSNPVNKARNRDTLGKLGLRNVVYRALEIDSFNARRLAHSLATRAWTLHWDGDMVACDAGTGAFRNLVGLTRSLNTRRYYYVLFFPLLNVGNDLGKIPANQIFQIEAWLYSNSRAFDWDLGPLLTHEAGRIERPRVPLFYRKRYLNQVYGIHLARFVPTTKWISKRLAYLWMTPEVRGQYPDYAAFYRDRRNAVTFHPDQEPYVPFDEQTYGPLPSLLEPYRGKHPDEIFPNFVADS